MGDTPSPSANGYRFYLPGAGGSRVGFAITDFCVPIGVRRSGRRRRPVGLAASLEGGSHDTRHPTPRCRERRRPMSDPIGQLVSPAETITACDPSSCDLIGGQRHERGGPLPVGPWRWRTGCEPAARLGLILVGLARTEQFREELFGIERPSAGVGRWRRVVGSHPENPATWPSPTPRRRDGLWRQRTIGIGPGLRRRRREPDHRHDAEGQRHDNPEQPTPLWPAEHVPSSSGEHRPHTPPRRSAGSIRYAEPESERHQTGRPDILLMTG